MLGSAEKCRSSFVADTPRLLQTALTNKADKKHRQRKYSPGYYAPSRVCSSGNVSCLTAFSSRRRHYRECLSQCATYGTNRGLYRGGSPSLYMWGFLPTPKTDQWGGASGLQYRLRYGRVTTPILTHHNAHPPQAFAPTSREGLRTAGLSLFRTESRRTLGEQGTPHPTNANKTLCYLKTALPIDTPQTFPVASCPCSEPVQLPNTADER